MLLRVPESWPQPLVGALAMTVLALLDLLGAVVAKGAVDRRSPGLAAVGVLVFAVLFWVYASSLQVAELATVTFGWVVILQVGVVLLDKFRYGGTMPVGKWLAVGVLLVAQGYLLLAPVGARGTDGAAAAEPPQPAGEPAPVAAATRLPLRPHPGLPPDPAPVRALGPAEGPALLRQAVLPARVPAQREHPARHRAAAGPPAVPQQLQARSVLPAPVAVPRQRWAAAPSGRPPQHRVHLTPARHVAGGRDDRIVPADRRSRPDGGSPDSSAGSPADRPATGVAQVPRQRTAPA